MRNILRWFVLLSFLASLIGPITGAHAQTQTPPPQVRALLNSMTPEERVGQLFLVTFSGTDVSEASPIYDLIANQHVGGVILQADNDNFVAEPDTVVSANHLINSLQSVEWESTVDESSPRKAYVPLLVGVSQEGDGVPNDQILSGMTPLPNEMAIGATWKTEQAKQVGAILGDELSAIGFNLFLGPLLDVLEFPNPSARSDLGTRVFGGDPFWVGEMGQAYISGLHEGSDDRLLVIAKHFPGRGSSDRSPEEDVATVRKSLEQLKQIELPPFFAVTNSTDATVNADGLLVSHIRYQGFQGNIRATTRPVSFDGSALSTILALPQLSTWRANGGLVVSDDLGSDAVRAFYSIGGEEFSPRLVARDAFLAGNDLLYLGNIKSNEFDDSYSAALRILASFSQEYRNDPVFAQLVDAAVARILTQKIRIYPTMNVDNVVGLASGSLNAAGSDQVAFDVARNAATLISPDPQELNTLLPAPPTISDRIVFLTDVSQYSQCSTCPIYDLLAVDSFENTVLRLFGPTGSGQVLRSRVSSFSLHELELLMDDTTETNIEAALSNSSWIVISLADVSDGQINILRRFFADRPNLIRNRNIILFSFTAPYYLDATDISKLTAYYALYSKQPTFIDAAARILFQQATVQGSSPVSIPAIGYDLIQQTSPDPDQIIPLQLDRSQPLDLAVDGTLTPDPTDVPSYMIGDSISVRTGPILDHNQHLVPDGTVVRFTMSTRDDAGEILNVVDVMTTDGIARASFVIDKPGNVEVRAASEPAVISDVVQLDATTEGVGVTMVPVITQTPEPPPPTQTVVPENNFISPEGYPRAGIWILVLLGVFGSALLTYWAVSHVIDPRWGVRFLLGVLVGGFGAYNYLALGFPRALEWISSDTGGPFGVLLFTLAGEALGIILTWVWYRRSSGLKSQAD